MKINSLRPRALLMLFGAAVLAAGLLALVGAKSAWAESRSFVPAPNSPLPVGSTPTTVTNADFNGDGKVDLAAQNAGSNTVSVLLGDGDGTFDPKQDFPVGSGPTSVISADFNADSFADLAVANQDSNNVSVLLNTPPDTTPPPPPIITNPPNNTIDSDGNITISGTAEANSTVELFEGSTSRGTATTNASDQWSKALTGVADGSHTYTAKARDAAGNTSGSSSPLTVEVRIPPLVSSVSPPNQTPNVAPSTNVEAIFSEAMKARSLRNATTLRSTTFALARKSSDGTTTKVAAKVSYDAAAKKATLDPDANLVRGARYVATVGTGAKDLAGNALDQNHAPAGDQPKAWAFTVKP
jgi:hypothetical protein